MNEFRLFAHGVDFDPESFLASTSLQFDGVWHKGESGHDHPKSSGVFKVLGDSRMVSVWEQERIAIKFLSANREALKALAQHPRVTTFILGLQYHMVLEGNDIGFCMGPSAQLMRPLPRHRHLAHLLRLPGPGARVGGRARRRTGKWPQ